MKKLFRLVIAGIVILCGIILSLYCGYLVFHVSDATLTSALVLAVLSGIALVVVGWSIANGATLRDVLRYFFTGMP